jgi:hypothetical protein
MAKAKKIEWKLTCIKASEIVGNPNNPKIRDEVGFKRLQKSIEKFGLIFSGIVNKDKTMIDGHSRLELASGNDDVWVFMPSRQLTDQECNELNSIYDLSTAGQIDFEKVKANLKEWDVDLDEWHIEKDEQLMKSSESGKEEIPDLVGNTKQNGEYIMFVFESFNDFEFCMSFLKANSKSLDGSVLVNIIKSNG